MSLSITKIDENKSLLCHGHDKGVKFYEIDGETITEKPAYSIVSNTPVTFVYFLDNNSIYYFNGDLYYKKLNDDKNPTKIGGSMPRGIDNLTLRKIDNKLHVCFWNSETGIIVMRLYDVDSSTNIPSEKYGYMQDDKSIKN